MQHRDILKDEIEQIGKVFAKIIAQFFQLQAKGNAGLAIEISHEKLTTELDIDIEQMANLPANELKEYFKKRKLKVEHLQLLTDYLIEVGKHQLKNNGSKAKKIFTKVLQIEDIILNPQNVYLFEERVTKSKKQVQVEALLVDCDFFG